MAKIFETGREKYHTLKNWYEMYEQKISTGSLLFGFVFDSLTLQRIDAWRENLWITLNIFIVATCIVFLSRKEGNDPKKHFWLFNLLQFSFGSILGGFFIFYFRSATLAVSWPFLALLLAAMVANELFQKKYARLVLQISFLYLSLYTFAIFLVPIVVHRIGAPIFLLSGLISLVGIWIFLRALQIFARQRFNESRSKIIQTILIIFVSVNVLYFTNLIPPIPLSLKDSGIYHSVLKNADGTYTVTEEKKFGILRYFSFQPEVQLPRGDDLYAYSAIFSPADLDTNIIHEWQYYNEDSNRWVTTTRIPLRLSGGRAEGFRTFSAKTNLQEGNWRVNVATPRGQLIGRIKFKLVPINTSPILQTSVK